MASGAAELRSALIFCSAGLRAMARFRQCGLQDAKARRQAIFFSKVVKRGKLFPRPRARGGSGGAHIPVGEVCDAGQQVTQEPCHE